MIWFCKAAVAHFNRALLLIFTGELSSALDVCSDSWKVQNFQKTLLPISAKKKKNPFKVKKLKLVIRNTPFDLLYEEITGVSQNINYAFILFECLRM